MRRRLLFVAAVAFLAHVGGLRNGFVYDDRRFIVENDALLTASWDELLLDPATHTADADRDIYRPLRALGHAFDRRRWDLEPFGFHLHSLAVHVANAVLALLVVGALVPRAGPGVALVAASCVAAHPLGVEVVAWASSRGDLYALLFALLALGAYALADRGRGPLPRAALAVAGALATALAVLGKESAAVVPVVAAVHARLERRRAPAALAGLCAGVLAAVVLHRVALGGGVPHQTAPHGGDALTQAGWALYGTARTLGHLIVPWGLAVEYPQQTWIDGRSPWERVPVLLVVGVVAVTVALCARRKPAGFGLAWILLAYLPSSSLAVTLRALVNDRAAYPLLPAFGLLVGLGAQALGGRRAAVLAACVLAVAWGALAIDRTADFRDERALWTAVLEHHPDSVKAHTGLAWVAARTDPARERDHLEAAVRAAIPGSRMHALALAQLGDVLLRKEGDARAAVPVLRASLAALRHSREKGRPAPEEASTSASLAWALWQVGDDAGARAVLAEALAVQPDEVLLVVVEALQAWLRSADGDESSRAAAIEAIRRARRMAPDHPIVVELSRRIESAPRR